MLMGVWWWAYGYRSCVWSFPKVGLSAWDWSCRGLHCLGCVPQTKFVGDAAWVMGLSGTLDFFASLVVWVWLSCVGSSCRPGVCRPSSVLIRWCDGYLGILLVGLFHCIVLGFFWVSMVL